MIDVSIKVIMSYIITLIFYHFMIKMHFVGNNWILAYEFRNLIAVKWHGILREGAVLECFG